MKLDEAIKHCEKRSDCTECGMEHQQLADWLEELKELRKKVNNSPDMWLARDKNNLLSMYTNKPVLNSEYDMFIPSPLTVSDKPWFPELTFENSPIKVKILVEENK